MQVLHNVGDGVVVADGCRDAVIGNISGWKGAVLRTFVYNSVRYYDIAVAVETLMQLSIDIKSELMKNGIAFTTIRVPEKCIIKLEDKRSSQNRAKVVQELQYEWYTTVGRKLHDPTKAKSDENDPTIITRRNLIKTLAVSGAFLLVSLAIVKGCSESGYRDEYSNWDNDGNGYYG